MTRLPPVAAAAALDDGQRVEQRLGSVDYDVWACAQCDARLVVPYDGAHSLERCPRCAFRTVRRSRQSLRAATTLEEGVEEITRTCAYCGWSEVRQDAIPRLPTPSASGGAVGAAGGAAGGTSDGGSGGASFGGDGGTAGGGGGSSY